MLVLIRQICCFLAPCFGAADGGAALLRNLSSEMRRACILLSIAFVWLGQLQAEVQAMSFQNILKRFSSEPLFFVVVGFGA